MKSIELNKCSKIMIKFLTIINQIKIYHWQTFMHPRHKATDQLYSELSDNIDKFIEILTGRQIIQTKNTRYRILLENSNTSIILANVEDNNGYQLIEYIKNFLESDELNYVIGTSTDLGNIRDEMLTSVNQVGYLFSLN
jgi:hypothetical protein